jgi:hypothetical protein
MRKCPIPPRPPARPRARPTDGRPRRRAFPAPAPPLLLLLAALLGGCSSHKIPYPHTNVGGMVSLDGLPIPRGMIVFTSSDPKYGQPIVSPIVRGRYIIDNVPLGDVLVIFNAFQKPESSVAGDRATPSIEINLIPPKYASGLWIKVTEKSSQIDFRLTTTPVPVPETARAEGEAGATAEPKPGSESDPKPEPEPEPQPGPGAKSGGPGPASDPAKGEPPPGSNWG